MNALQDYKGGGTNGENLVAVCLNNKYISDRFDVGVEYLFEMLSMTSIWVWDKFGVVGAFPKDQFAVRKGK